MDTARKQAAEVITMRKAKLVLDAIAEAADGDGIASPGLAQLAARTGFTVNDVRAAIQLAEALGDLVRLPNERTGRPGRPRARWQVTP